MKYVTTCAECARLWREYAASTTEHIRVEGKLKLAAISRENDKMIELMIKVDAAATKRDADRAAIQAHEQAAHPPADSATA